MQHSETTNTWLTKGLEPMTFTNVFFDEPDEGFFAIPHECFQQGAKASGRVTRPKSFFRSLETVV